MNRRNFSASLLAISAGLALGPRLPKAMAVGRHLRPARLRAGDQVGLLSPASYIEDEALEKAVGNLESLGLKPVLSTHIRSLYGSLAGSDAERLSDLHRMFADPAIKGIWCARGGYGCARLLPDIDYRLIRQNPKVLVGYSDITALHNAIYRHSGLVTFHGPVGSSTLTDYTRAHLVATLFEGQAEQRIGVAPAQAEKGLEDAAFATQVIRPGVAEGRLVGGNLSLLASLAGTRYQPDIAGTILYIEDIGEKPYRLDRMLTTLRQAWPLEKVAGIALGVFNDCQPEADSRSLTLLETLQDRLADLPVPISYGLSFGHIDDMCTLPYGVRARLDTQEASLTLLEAGVS